MIKQLIKVKRKIISFKCSICKIRVNPNFAKPMTIETEKIIIQSWDYGHQHKKIFTMLNGKPFLLEGRDI